MLFLMICHHHEGVDAIRDATRPAHRAHVASGSGGLVRVVIGSGMLGETGTGVGNFGIIEAASRPDVVAFAEADPFFSAGVIQGIEVHRLPETFPAHRILAADQ